VVPEGHRAAHADRFWAAALAVSAAREGSVDYAYRPAGAGAGTLPDGLPDLSAPVRPWWRPPLGARLTGRIV
jgi:hypothetical protein